MLPSYRPDTGLLNCWPGKCWSPMLLVIVCLLCCLTSASLVAQAPSPQSWNYDARLLQGFWNSELVEGESVLFVRDTSTGTASAQVLFPVGEVVAVRNSQGDVTYEAGRDYRWEPRSRKMTLPEGSRIVASLPSDLRRPAKSQAYELTHRDGNGEILFGGKLEYARLQTCVTYRPASRELTHLPAEFDPRQLPRCVKRLQNKAAFKLVVLGDSISAGANASGSYEAAPYQPAYPELVRRGLAEHYGGPVELLNLSVGGRDSAWGITQVESVVAAKPDLVIIAFGMNDAAGRASTEFKQNTQKIIEAIATQSPTTEFVLVATMLGNRDWIRLKTELFPQYRDALLELRKPGVAVADLTSLWSAMLERKLDWDLTGNGVNHPNDFGHRIYAQVVLSLLR